MQIYLNACEIRAFVRFYQVCADQGEGSVKENAREYGHVAVLREGRHM